MDTKDLMLRQGIHTSVYTTDANRPRVNDESGIFPPSCILHDLSDVDRVMSVSQIIKMWDAALVVWFPRRAKEFCKDRPGLVLNSALGSLSGGAPNRAVL